jgi:hypothetical protein
MGAPNPIAPLWVSSSDGRKCLNHFSRCPAGTRGTHDARPSTCGPGWTFEHADLHPASGVDDTRTLAASMLQEMVRHG